MENFDIISYNDKKRGENIARILDRQILESIQGYEEEKNNMTVLTLIAACDRKGCIGKNGKLPWNIRSEMNYFLKRVAFKPLVMGRKTCLSLKRPINSAPNYVLTSDPNFKREGFITVNDIREVMDIAKDHQELIVVGGGNIYAQFLIEADNNPDVKLFVELSHIDTEIEGGDTYFPLDRLTEEEGFTTATLHKHFGSDYNWEAIAYYKKTR